MSSSGSEALLSLVGHGEAPGRLDFMGGVADYSGSMVLEMPIRSVHLRAHGTDETQHWHGLGTDLPAVLLVVLYAVLVSVAAEARRALR